MKHTNLRVGQKLYARHTQDETIDEYIITKIGRKYFYINDGIYKRNFDIDTLYYTCKEWSEQNLQLYRTKQEIIDIRIERDIYYKLRKVFSSFSNYGPELGLDQLKKIADILNLSY